MAYLNDLQSKRRTKEDQGEEFGERKTSIVRCHATLLGHCMTAQMMTATTHVHVALKAEDPSMVFLCFKAHLKM